MLLWSNSTKPKWKFPCLAKSSCASFVIPIRSMMTHYDHIRLSQPNFLLIIVRHSSSVHIPSLKTLQTCNIYLMRLPFEYLASFTESMSRTNIQYFQSTLQYTCMQLWKSLEIMENKKYLFLAKNAFFNKTNFKIAVCVYDNVQIQLSMYIACLIEVA